MALISEIDIANMALSHLHARSRVETFSETSTEARLADLWYDPARRQALSDFNWGFARVNLALATHSVDPSDGWSFRYQWPADALMARRMVNPAGLAEDAAQYVIGNAGDGTKSILSDVENATLIYTRDEEQTSLFTPHFVITLSFLLAFYLAGTITGKAAFQNRMTAAYQNQLSTAAAADVNQEQSQAGPREAEWIRGR